MGRTIRSNFHEVMRDSWSAHASDYSTDIGLGAPVGQSRRAAKLENIVHLFSERYKTLRKILRQQCGFRESHSIAARENNGQMITFPFHAARLGGSLGGVFDFHTQRALRERPHLLPYGKIISSSVF